MRTSYFFDYSDRYRSGSFDMRDVRNWISTGDSYYKQYIISFANGDKVYLNPDEFYEFEKKFNKLELPA